MLEHHLAKSLGFLAVAAVLLAAALPGVADTLVFGSAASEKAHRFEGDDTKAVMGALGEPARVSLPKTPVDYYGGDLSFDMAIDPIRQNYFTVSETWKNGKLVKASVASDLGGPCKLRAGEQTRTIATKPGGHYTLDGSLKLVVTRK